MTKWVLNSDRAFWLAAGAIVVFVYFFGLNIPLLGPDEPRYAQVAREMFERGDWITPTLGGFHWFEKPALLYWLQTVSYSAFGVSEFSARFGSALFGLGTVIAMWILGRTYAGETGGLIEGDGGSRTIKRTANWFALFMASSLGLIVFSRGASFDIILTFPIAASLISYYVFDSRSRRSNEKSLILPLFLFYFFAGVALLAKGLVGAVFPFSIVFVYQLFVRRLPARAFLVSLVWGSIVIAAVSATWYVPMYLRHGWKFIDEFFIQHHFQRYTSNKYLHPQPFYFFFWVLPLMTIPWIPFFFSAVWTSIRRKIRRSKPADGTDAKVNEANSSDDKNSGKGSGFVASPLFAFATAWVLVPLLFFSFSGSKLPGYILPVLPAAMIITAIYSLEVMRKRPGLERWLRGLAIATFAVVTALIIFVLPRFADTDSVKGLLSDAERLGYGNSKVLAFNTLSHNAEFYASGRLLRNENGRQKRFDNGAEILAAIDNYGAPGALVLVPVEYETRFLASGQMSTERIRDNGDYVLYYVRPKE